MGALLFIGLMFVLLCLGGFFLLLGLIFLFLRHHSKKKGTPKKRHAILAGAFFTLGAVVCTLPIGYWLFLRSANSSISKDYVDTGKTVEGGYHAGTFTVDGVTYVPLDQSASGLCPKGEAVFSWDSSSGLERFFGYYDRGNYYTVENAPSLDLIRDSSINRRLWCRSDQLTQAEAWYGDSTNYQWYLYSHHKYTLLSPQPGEEQIAALLAGQAGEWEAVEFTVPNDTEIQKYSLNSISTDKVVHGESIILAVYDGQICMAGVWNSSHTDTTRTDTAYPLPADLADYFSNLLSD